MPIPTGNIEVVLLSMQSESCQISQKKILICVPKMNKGPTYLEWHESE